MSKLLYLLELLLSSGSDPVESVAAASAFACPPPSIAASLPLLAEYVAEPLFVILLLRQLSLVR
jgi:hypothetical protein